MTKYQNDHQKLSDEITQAELRYTELNEALEGIHNQIRDARVSNYNYQGLLRMTPLLPFKVDSHENSRTQRKLELLENLKRLYPGVHGRLMDLCEPVQRRYHVAITKVMGRNMDAIVVDHEKTGRDCIQYIKEMVNIIW